MHWLRAMQWNNNSDWDACLHTREGVGAGAGGGDEGRHSRNDNNRQFIICGIQKWVSADNGTQNAQIMPL